jgi:hypothetical protein
MKRVSNVPLLVDRWGSRGLECSANAEFLVEGVEKEVSESVGEDCEVLNRPGQSQVTE